MNLAPSNWRDAVLWAARTQFLAWNEAFAGAVAYAIRRSPALEQTVATAAACADSVPPASPANLEELEVIDFQNNGPPDTS